MHGEVDFVAQQRVLDFLDEEAFAADLGKWRFLKPVAGRLDDDDAAGHVAGFLQTRGDGVGLPQRQLAAARSQSQLARHGGAQRPDPVDGFDFGRNGSTRLSVRSGRAGGSGTASAEAVSPNRRVSASE